jgi:dihydroxyacid dehydratase/phosphogluconate dehydratase
MSDDAENGRYNRNSRDITEGDNRAPNRAMLRAVGFKDGDFGKPIVGVANGQSDITPCNAGLGDLSAGAAAAIREAGGMPQTFGTITISDGISMGTEGMKCSLVSREVIADSIETVCRGQRMDGVIAVGGCDKNMPGAMIAMARLNIPSVFVYGGTIKPGHYDGKDLTIVSTFEAVGEFGAGRISREYFCEVEKRACPGKGSCGGMYTANTMSSAIEAMGMSLPKSSTMAAEDAEKAESAADSGRVLMELVRNDVKPRNIMTKPAFENAIAVIMAVGGSTNAVLHLLAIAHATGVDLALDDFERIRDRTPVFCDLKPSGKYVATDLHAVGGIPLVMKMLLEAGLLARRRAERSAGRPRRRAGERRSDIQAGPSRDPSRQSRPRGQRREDQRHRPKLDHRPGPRFRQRRGLHGRDHERRHQSGRRDRDPLRRSERRSGNARDAFAHECADRQRARRQRRSHYRRPFFGRHLRHGRRSRFTRSAGRRSVGAAERR